MMLRICVVVCILLVDYVVLTNQAELVPALGMTATALLLCALFTITPMSLFSLLKELM